MTSCASTMCMAACHSELSSPDAHIGVALLGHRGGLVDIAQVYDHWATHHALDPIEIERAKLVPFGQQEHGIGTLETNIGIACRFQSRHETASLRHSLRIECAHARAVRLQGWNYGEARGLPHVIGIGLEGQSEHRNQLAGNGSAAS